MAGSRKWMVYESDAGVPYAVQIDESNGEAADFDDYGILFEIAGVTLPVLPKGFQMRYANAQTTASEGGSRKIWVGKATSGIISGVIATVLLPYFSGTTLGAAVAYAISSIVGEKSGSRPKIADTGILDGDAS